MWEIRRYSAADSPVWDAFVTESRNATFLFRREYMDYHADRFTDCSIMAYRNGRLSAILPANISGAILHSHQGLTYGGWLLPASGIDGGDIIDLWKEWLKWCAENSIENISYKPVPTIYHKMPSQEDLYLLFLTRSNLVGTNLASAINLSRNPGISKLQRRHLKSVAAGYEIVCAEGSGKEEVTAIFHAMLTECLSCRHDAVPVHSLRELSSLANAFPENIGVWMLLEAGKPMAGVCAYITDTCFHCQYIATTEAGREGNYITPLFTHLINLASKAGKTFFDFGTSNENGGLYLNRGLNRHKTSFGASGAAYMRWEISVADASESLSNV